MAFELTAHDPDDRQRQRENERRYRAGHKAELQALADTSLGPSYDQHKIAMVAQLLQQLRQQQEVLVHQIDLQFINKRQYLEQFHLTLNRIYSECEQILGSQDFEKLFGGPLAQIVHMIDPDIFLSTH